MADEAINVLRQALAATQSADAGQRKQGKFGEWGVRCVMVLVNAVVSS